MIIAIDFDGTCIDHTYPHILRDAPHSVSTLREMVRVGHKLILWTMRSGDELKAAVDWFYKNNIELYGIQVNPTQHTWTTSRKCYAELYIDDAAFGCPLIKPEGFNRSCVDWLLVRQKLGLIINE